MKCYMCEREAYGVCEDCGRPGCSDHSWETNGPCLECWFGNDYCYECKKKVVNWKIPETIQDLIDCDECGYQFCKECIKQCPVCLRNQGISVKRMKI